MADMEKERIEEGMDEFLMYAEWAKNGDIAGENVYEQEIPQFPVSEGTEKRHQVPDESQEAEFPKPGKTDWIENGYADTEEARSREMVSESEKKTAEESKTPRNPFEALIKIVEKNAPEKAEALKEVQQYMEEMDNHYKSMRSELDDLKRQLAERPDSSGLGKQAVQNLEKSVDGLKAHREGFLKKIFRKAAGIIDRFKAKGVIALNGIVEKLGIKENLMEDRKYYLDNAAKMQKSIDKLDAINSEYYAARGHFKNIGRLAVGKEALQPPQDKENALIRVLKAPYVHYRNRYQAMADKAGKKIARLESLEQKAAHARSTLAKLSEYKKETASRDESRKDSQNKEIIGKKPEMAL